MGNFLNKGGQNKEYKIPSATQILQIWLNKFSYRCQFNFVGIAFEMNKIQEKKLTDTCSTRLIVH